MSSLSVLVKIPPKPAIFPVDTLLMGSRESLDSKFPQVEPWRTALPSSRTRSAGCSKAFSPQASPSHSAIALDFPYYLFSPLPYLASLEDKVVRRCGTRPTPGGSFRHTFPYFPLSVFPRAGVPFFEMKGTPSSLKRTPSLSQENLFFLFRVPSPLDSFPRGPLDSSHFPSKNTAVRSNKVGFPS